MLICIRQGGRFPERPVRAVLLPERFRGGCSFGARFCPDWIRAKAGLSRASCGRARPRRSGERVSIGSARRSHWAPLIGKAHGKCPEWVESGHSAAVERPRPLWHQSGDYVAYQRTRLLLDEHGLRPARPLVHVDRYAPESCKASGLDVRREVGTPGSKMATRSQPRGGGDFGWRDCCDEARLIHRTRRETRSMCFCCVRDGLMNGT